MQGIPDLGSDFPCTGFVLFVGNVRAEDFFNAFLPGEYDTREVWVFVRPLESLDIKIGRQILTWGTGDQDAYLKPRVKYKWTDNITVETGANILTGKEIYTFFGQFEDNTNVYTAIRFSF